MVPFQLVIIKSSPSARPYEHASYEQKTPGQPLVAPAKIGRILTRSLTFLSFLELLQEPEIPRDLGTHSA